MKKFLLSLLFVTVMLSTMADEPTVVEFGYVTDTSIWIGEGIAYSTDANLGIAIRIPSDVLQNYKGGKIIGMKVAAADQSKEQEIRAFVRKGSLTSENLASTTDYISWNSIGGGMGGFSSVLFDSPWTIPTDLDEDAYLGLFTTVKANQRVIGVSSVQTAKANTVFISESENLNELEPSNWNDITSISGLYSNNICIKCIIESPHPSIQSGNLSYTIDSRQTCATVVGTKLSTLENLVIPDYITHDGIDYPVTAIAASAFMNLDGLIGTLKIGANVTSIGDYAFIRCRLSGSLILPETLTNIGDYAFAGCNFSGELRLPQNIKEIGVGAFQSSSSSFSHIIALSEVPPVCNNAIFNPDAYQNTYLIVPDGSISTYQSAYEWEKFDNISNASVVSVADVDIIKYLINTSKNEATVIGIADDDFPFTDIVIPNSILFQSKQINVVSIVARAFENLYFTGLLSLGKNIRSIGSNAFLNCSRLTGSLKLPSSLLYLGENAFKGCSGLNGELVLPNSLTEISEGAFSGCSNLSGQLKLPSSLKVIHKYAFCYCMGLSGQLSLPSGITEVGDAAFAECSGLNGTLIIPSSLNKISNYVFYGCTGLTGNLILPQSLTEIGSHSFQNCSGLSGNLNIPESVTAIGGYAFQDCSGLDGTLTLPSRLEEIREHTFEKCSFTGSLIIPESVKKIGEYAFNACKNLSGVLEIPESIKWIDQYCFANCKELETLILPKSLDVYGGTYSSSDKSSIQSKAFNGCSGITKIVSKKEIAPTCNISAFDNSTYSQATLFVPTSAMRSYQMTDPWRNFSGINSLEPLSSIEFLEPNIICPLNGKVQLFLKKIPAGATGDITFISGNSAVVTIDSNGVVTGVSKGSTAIIAMSGTLTASCVVTVEDPTIPAVALNFIGIIGKVGESVTIGAEVIPEDVTDPTVNWMSSNPNVAAVDSDGKVWFNAAGSATVTAECQGHKFSVPFIVEEVMAHALNVFPVEAVGGIGHQFSLLALHEPENTTDKSVVWESSDPSIASVDSDGRVELTGIGSAQITARSGEHSAVSDITVTNNPTVVLTEMASSGVIINIVSGGITVRNAPEGASIAVYTIDGKVVNGAIVEGIETHLSLASGIYIVKITPDTIAKVLIK